MKKVIALLLSLLMLGLTAYAETDLATVPRTIMEDLYAGEYQKVFDLSSADVKAALGTADAFEQVFSQIALAYGPYEAVSSATAAESSGYIRATIVCAHKMADVTYTIVLGSDGMMAGFTIAGITPKAAATEKAPDNGIIREDILLRPGQADETKGILTLPAGTGLFPAVIMIQGSGPSDRDETAFGNTPFRDIADGLAKAGIASIRYDKYTYAHADLLTQDAAAYARFTVNEEYINDAKAAAGMLLADGRLAGIYLLGHSQGAMLVPRIMQALGAGVVSGGILLEGTPRHLWEIQYHQNLQAAAALTGADVTAAAALIAAEYDKAISLPGMTEKELLGQTVFGIPAYYQKDEAAVDAAATVMALGTRLFISQGGKDWQVTPADGMDAWKSMLGGTLDVTYRLYENMNHMLFDMAGAPLGTLADYSAAAQVSQALIADIAAWIKAQ
jgi:uncharacterized protein